MKFTALIAVVFLCLMPALSRAAAYCTAANTYQTPQQYVTISSTVELAIPGSNDTVLVPPNAAPNTVLATLTPDSMLIPGLSPPSYGTISILCYGTSQAGYYLTGRGAYNSTYQTYATNIPGIGLRLWLVAGRFTYPSSGAMGCPSGAAPCSPGVVGQAIAAKSLDSVQIVKTGPVTTGGTLSGPIGGFGVTGIAPAYLFEWNLDAITINPGIPTCAVMGNGTIAVPLPTLKGSDFNSSPNPSAGNSQPFALTVGNCQNASTATFTFSGDEDTVNPVLFKNTGGATGVAVRLYPTANNTQTIGANNTNNVFPVQIAGGQASLSVGAQYYKTGATVGAGSVISKATVIMSYN